MTTKTATPTPKATRKQIEMIEAHLELSRQIEDLEAMQAEVAARLVRSIGLGNTVEAEEIAQVTVTSQTSYDIDFEALVQLRPTWARKVTKKVFDRRKFNLLKQAGEVPADVLELAREKTTDPFLRITLRQPKS